ncbi:MAG: hypothetical protein PHH58_14795 [Rhodoferax sp.]|nr:hypothetical protein [Rhodoferax sp.]
MMFGIHKASSELGSLRKIQLINAKEQLVIPGHDPVSMNLGALEQRVVARNDNQFSCFGVALLP